MSAAAACHDFSGEPVGPLPTVIADKDLVARAFGNASATYDGASRLQQLMGDAMLDAWPYPDGQGGLRILDLGCGTGWFTHQLAQRPAADITAVDLSPGMIRATQERVGAGVTCLVADAEALPCPDASFDVVFSNLMVQWCEAPDRVLAECRRLLRPGGRLMLSTLLDGTLVELARAWAQADPGQAHVNRFETESSLRRRVSQQLPGATVTTQTIKLPYESPLTLAAELKNLGAGFKSDNRRKTLTAPGRVRQMCRHYPKAADGRTLASYEAAWITWRRPA